MKVQKSYIASYIRHVTIVMAMKPGIIGQQVIKGQDVVRTIIIMLVHHAIIEANR